MATRVKINRHNLSRLTRGPGSVGFRAASEMGTRVQTVAKTIVRVGVETGDPVTNQRGESVHPHLRDTIVKRVILGGGPGGWDRAGVVVGSDLYYARWEHEGTEPHPIYPKNARALRFPTTRGGNVYVFTQRVRHPGTKGSFFLTKAAEQVGLRIRGLLR